MLHPFTLVLTMTCTVAAAQEAPPVAPTPSTPGFPGDAGEGGEGLPGGATPVPELMARTPAVARATALIGVEVLEADGRAVGRLDDLVIRTDGRLIAIVVREDGHVVGLPLSELIARAKPDPTRGPEHATIRNFKLSREARRLESAPEVADKSRLDEAWLAQLDGESEPPPPSEGEPGAPASAPLTVLSALLGRPALDPSGQPLGSLAEVVVDVGKARVAYLLVQRRDEPEAPAGLHAVAYETLVAHADEAGVQLSIDAQELRLRPRIEGLTRLPVDPLAAAGAAEPDAPR